MSFIISYCCFSWDMDALDLSWKASMIEETPYRNHTTRVSSRFSLYGFFASAVPDTQSAVHITP